MGKKKFLLDMDDDLIDQKILGIVSSQPHLEFVHSLNKTGYFNFERIHDFELNEPQGTRFFIQFKFEDKEINELIFLLVSKGNAGYLSKELHGIDYVLLIRSEDENIVERISDLLKIQKNVMATIALTGKNISEKLKRLLSN